MADKTKNKKKKSPMKVATGSWIASSFFIKRVLPMILICLLFATFFVMRTYMMRDVNKKRKELNKKREEMVVNLKNADNKVTKFTQSQEAIANQLTEQGVKINEGEKFILHKDK